MASIVITQRDLALFRALDGGPLTTRQILTLGATFPGTFPGLRRTQRRLHTLRKAGLLRQWWYATEGPGRTAYYTLSPTSFRLLYPGDPGPARACGEVGISLQRHTRLLADFRVHTAVAAHAAGIGVIDEHRENVLQLSANGDTFYPDRGFTLVAADRPLLHFFVELDTGTEPVRSTRERESWLKKLRLYEALRDTCGFKFRVLGVTTRSAVRVDNMLSAAAEVARDPMRPLLYATCLSDYLATANPLEQPCFRSHRGEAVSLVPPLRQAPSLEPLPVLSMTAHTLTG